ncbi:MAG: hypothetical protein A3K19_24020 [Lentisphaerae bacterium RIFOXYB12_FULL_65_16]|nr:MAG: hypothetical protein A3K18_10265 [Lentisphaerae bacterium RIFOXYA12_64_32]OGV89584.1 MAG: hypothetical protein A3K19_24020 [Lentisphaerae bacterium RIFOXYB12_FULL_65_16]
MHLRHVLPALGLACVLATPLYAIPPGLLFHVSFDKLTPDADVAKGDGHSSFAASLELRPAEGVKGAGLLQQAGERCSYSIAGNFDTSQGSYSVWVKPLNWDGHGGKFRHILVADPAPGYTMLLYLYPIGDEAVMNYIRVGANTPDDATWRAGCPVDIFKKGEWTHLVSTWDATAVRLYANGQRVAEGLVSSPLPKLTTGTFTICPVDFWKNAQWGDRDEQTVCDEVRVFDHALTDEEVLDLYAADIPGGLAALEPKLVLDLKPDYFANAISATVRPAHLSDEWRARIAKGAAVSLTVRDPAGTVLLTRTGKLDDGRITVPVKDWRDGDYAAEADLTADDQSLKARAKLTKPPTPWLPPQKDWRADRVLEPWTPLARDGQTVRYWNGEITLAGALPDQITSGGQPLLAGPIRFVAEAPATWSSPRVTEEQPWRITVEGTGQLGELSVTSTTLVEFDGLIRTDVTLTPPAEGMQIPALTLEIPLRAEFATYYRNPACRDWDGKALDEVAFLPYAWLGNEERGLSWFMESAANWRIAEKQPAMTFRREGDTVVVRLRLISDPVQVTKPLTYTVGFEATPVRPLSLRLYEWRFASGPQFKGSNLFVYGWSQQISYLNSRLIAFDPAGQRKLVDTWRADGKESLSYSCAQCTAGSSPEYLFFADEWNQPYGATFSGYKRVPDDAPYSIVPVCPRSTFPDFLVWCVTENLRNDWGGGIYTDIDGATPCDNALHGCGFTDAFGRTGRTWPLYAHRGLSRRIYAACHDAGKFYFAHAHSNWYSLFNAFNDGWCPGEQYSTAVVGKPNFYMDDIPDRVWRTEFHSPTTGVATFLLPEMGRFGGKDSVDDRGPSECCISAALCYGVPLWAGAINRTVVEEVWAVQQEFGIAGAEFVPFWKQQDLVASDPAVRVSLWRKPGSRLVVLANFTDTDRTVELRPAQADAKLQTRAAWNAPDFAADGSTARLTVKAKRGSLLVVTGP